MNANCCVLRYCALGLAVGLSVLTMGCAAVPPSRSSPSYQLSDMEGKWSWIQGPWRGDFVLKKDGGSCAGTLNDTWEGTYGDKIVDVIVSNDHVKLTRNGKYGIQHWEGTLRREHGLLKIVDGRWTTEQGSGGMFVAEKKD